MHQKALRLRNSYMGEDIGSALRHIRRADPPAGLLNTVLLRITREKTRAARIQFGIPASLAAVSLISSVPAARYAFDTFAQSSFAGYFSLMFSDGAAMALRSQDLILSLIESLPFSAVVVAPATLLILLFSTRLAFRNMHLAGWILPRRTRTV